MKGTIFLLHIKIDFKLFFWNLQIYLINKNIFKIFNFIINIYYKYDYFCH